MLESIRKAREAVAKDAFTNANLANAFDAGTMAGLKDTLPVVFDAIEAEIAEKYMELPLDADGVPIHVGDELRGYGLPDGGAIVKALNNGMVIVGRLEGGENYAKSGLLWCASETRHYKQRTIEDVLMDLAIGVLENDGYDNEDIKRYADEIRKAAGE